VGDVLAVTRSLAREGMAMMAVTRKMFIAREVAGRVAVTDVGGVRHTQDRHPVRDPLQGRLPATPGA